MAIPPETHRESFGLHISGGGGQIARVADTVTSAPDNFPNPAEDQPLTRAVILAVAATSLVVAAFAVTAQSYWIDEAMSLIVAMAPSPGEAWRYAQAVGAPAQHAPLYHVYLYAWHKVAGPGEWAMRASNIPWFVLAQLAFLLLLRHRPKLALTACLLAAVNPAIWMYLDEARPYIMQYAAACWLVASVARRAFAPSAGTAGEDRLAFLAAGGATIVLCGSGLPSVVWAAGLVSALFLLRRTAPVTPGEAAACARPRYAIAGFAVLLALLAASHFYAWPGFSPGSSDLKQFVKGLIYVAYEFLGFSGFGPGKLELRLSPLGSIIRRLPVLLPLAACLGVLGIFAVRQAGTLLQHRRAIAAWMIALALPGVFLLGADLILEQRPVPRDFVPALPAIILSLAAVILAALAQKSIFLRGAAAAVPILWLASGLNLRWQQAHAKDDYRAAAAVAAAALRDNKEVWWAADAATAFIYLTPISMEQVPGRVWAMQGPDWSDLRLKLPPRVIVISKPDIYDARGAVSRYAMENHFVPALQLQAITILTRESDRLPAAAPRPLR